MSTLSDQTRAPPRAAEGDVIHAEGLTKTYDTPAGPYAALRGIDFSAKAGECVAVLGPSGSGKSTLLNLLAGIDRPTSGALTVAGAALNQLAGARVAPWRGRNVGVVFQFFQLLPTLTALENVMLPMDLVGVGAPRDRKPRARDLLARVGVLDQAAKLPAALSGGQQQRVAIARALANDPPIVLADEPTGNLDSEAGDAVLALLTALARGGKAVVVVTHEKDAAARFTRTVTLRDGRVVS